MKKKCIISAMMTAILLVTGCSGDTTSSSEPQRPTDGEGRIIPITDSYTQSSYTPKSDGWSIMTKEIPGAFGEVTDTKIPAVFLATEDPAAITKEEYVPCTVQIDAGMTDGEFSSTDVLQAEIRGRGHSTWEWPKKPYKIKLEEKTSLLGMSEAKRWVLLANYADESLLRNTTAFEIARSLGSFRFVPHAIPVDVYMNGIYQGVYTLGEQLEVRSSRLAIDDTLAKKETGYLMEIGGADPNTDTKGWNYFDLPSGCGVNILIKSPETEIDPNAEYNWTQEHFDYIYDYMCKADTAITTLTDYEDYINVDSFIDWFLVHELTYNLDSCFRRSCYITKPVLCRLEMGPIWDFDLAFGNMYMDNPQYDDWATLGDMGRSSYIGVTWFNYLMTDDSFRERARARWDEVKDTMVQSALGAIDAWKPKIMPSAELNFSIWNTLGIANGFQPEKMKDVDTYLDQVLYLRKFINNRSKWIDENL